MGLMKKRLLHLKDKVSARLPVADEEFLFRGSELDVASLREPAPSMALRWCLAQEL